MLFVITVDMNPTENASDVKRFVVLTSSVGLNLFYERQTAQWCLKLIINLQGVGLSVGRCQSDRWSHCGTALRAKGHANAQPTLPYPTPTSHIYLIQSRSSFGVKNSAAILCNPKLLPALEFTFYGLPDARVHHVPAQHWWKNTLICQSLRKDPRWQQ